MDDEGEDCIAVGSTGTLLSLMGKEMEILQARRSCSVSYNSNMNYKKSPSAKVPSSIFGHSPASPLLMNPNPPSTNIVSSLWSDLKGLLLKSPTSIYHNNHVAHSPLIYDHNNALPCSKDQQLQLQLQLESDINYLDHINKSPSQAYSPLRPLSHPSPLRTPSHCPSPFKTRAHYPENGMSQAAPIRSPSSKDIFPKEAVFHSFPSQKASMAAYPKEKLATDAISYSNQKSSLDLSNHRPDYPHGKSSLHNYCSQEIPAAGAADYPINRLHQKRSDIAYVNRKDTDHVYQVTPTGINQESRKGNRPAKEGSLAGADATKHCPKGKNMDAASPSLQYPKAKAMDAVYAMRRSAEAHSQSGKLLQELELAKEGRRISRNSCSRKREETAMTGSNMLQDDSCTQKREQRGYVQNPCVQKREERERERMQMRREESVYCMQAECCICMQQPMLEEYYASSPCFKPSRSFGGRSLPLVSVVDLQCCHTPDRPSRRLSFTRLSSF